MTLSISYQQMMMRYMNEIQRALQEASSSACVSTLHSLSSFELDTFYGQINYHLSWVDRHFLLVKQHMGKLLRPLLLLLSYEAAGAWESLMSSLDYIVRHSTSSHPINPARRTRLRRGNSAYLTSKHSSLI
jgi:geranylgeranyl diphosphate synthase type I